ncbi:MAG: tetratricopeptide repeat protein [Aggregatilineales bacterium]
MGDSILLKTKFLVPHPGAMHLSRQSLVSQICSPSGQQRVMLIAPAGYGKTSVLTEVADHYLHPLTWIQLDEGDNDPATFIAYLFEGLSRQIEDVNIAIPSEDTIAPDHMLIILLNQLLEQTVPAWMLILDDYHVIRNPVVHQLVTTLMENLPPQMRVVIASRITPVLPLARWRARNQLLELRAERLRFSTQEAEQWLSQQYTDLSSPMIADLVAKTEGWGAGLQLASALLNECDDKAHFITQLSGTQPHIFDYLMEEVFAQQPSEIQTFLLRSSVFAELNPEICATVLATESATEILATLERHSLFIARLDYQSQWYRYHQLFRDFLLSKFNQQPDYTATQLSAGTYFANMGLPETAIQHFILAGDNVHASQMLCAFADTYLLQGRVDEIQTYLNALSSEIRQINPRILLLQGRILRHNGQFGSALEHLETARVVSDDPTLHCNVYVEIAAIRHSQGQYQQAYDTVGLATRLGDAVPASDYVHALMQMARCAGFVNGMDEGRKLAEQAYEIMQAQPEQFTLYERARLLEMLGQICWWHGDALMAIDYCKRGLALLDDTQTPLRARLLITLSIPTLYQKDYQQALEGAKDAIDICQALHLKETLPSAYAAFGNVLTRTGQLEQAESALRTAITQAEAIGGARFSQVMAAGYLAQNLALQGRTSEARRLAEQALTPYENQPIVYDVYVCRSVLADLLLDADKLDHAKQIYSGLIAVGEHTQYRIPLAMAYFGIAYILMQENNREQALEYSQESLKLLEPAMMHQLYLDQHERALVVCSALVQHMPQNSFVGLVYQLLSDHTPQPSVITITEPDRIKIETLGGLWVIRDGKEIEPKAFASAKARDLLAYFITSRTKSINLDRAVDALWPDGSASTNAFHTALYRVRVALRQKGEKEKFILSEVGEYRLDTAKFDVDIDRFDSILKRAESASGEQAAQLYERALEFYQGAYLDNMDYEWITIERERLQRNYLKAIHQYSELLIEDTQFHMAITWLRKALELEPYDENLHIKYMQTLAQAGQHQTIVAHYQQLTDLLNDVFHAPPMPETQYAYERLTK